MELKPKFSAGEHSLVVSASDCFGNKMPEQEWTFKVAIHFEIQMLGNYPNPFARKTVFAYILTRPCEQVKLKIYTASGIKICNMNTFETGEDPYPLGADYHEVTWDGLDDDGNEVANGVYFYQLSATSSGQNKQVTGKIAKIK